MIDLEIVKQAAHVVKDAQGKSVVQIPADIWDAVIVQMEVIKQKASQSAADRTKQERWQTFLQEWGDENAK